MATFGGPNGARSSSPRASSSAFVAQLIFSSMSSTSSNSQLALADWPVEEAALLVLRGPCDSKIECKNHQDANQEAHKAQATSILIHDPVLAQELPKDYRVPIYAKVDIE